MKKNIIRKNIYAPNDDYSVSWNSINKQKNGNVVTLYQRESFKIIPSLGTFCTQSVNEALIYWEIRTYGHEGPEVEQSYSSIRSFASALYRIGGLRHVSVTLPPEETPGTHCTGGWVGPGDCLDGCHM
jgi:hypothetical protein